MASVSRHRSRSLTARLQHASLAYTLHIFVTGMHEELSTGNKHYMSG